MASLGLGFGGQGAKSPDNVVLPGGSNQHFLMHCEIEGPGMHDLLVLLEVLLGVFIAAIFVWAIPVVGPILSVILILLALLALLIGAPAITHDVASPPSDGFGGTFNPYDPTKNPKDPVDIAYVFGRWVYESLHTGARVERTPSGALHDQDVSVGHSGRFGETEFGLRAWAKCSSNMTPSSPSSTRRPRLKFRPSRRTGGPFIPCWTGASPAAAIPNRRRPDR